MSLWDKRRRFGAGALLLGFLLLAGCAGEPAPEAPPLREPKGVTMDIVPVRRGEIWITETYEGLVLPRVRELSFPASGRMSGVNVCPGSHVKAGDVLASLDVSLAASALEAQRDYLSYREKTEAISQRELEIQIELKRLETESLRRSGAGNSAIRLSELQAQ
jgi:multidrug efflux pump subunit AcrA (membrane-fusion protein)